MVNVKARQHGPELMSRITCTPEPESSSCRRLLVDTGLGPAFVCNLSYTSMKGFRKVCWEGRIGTIGDAWRWTGHLRNRDYKVLCSGSGIPFFNLHGTATLGLSYAPFRFG